MIVIKDGPEFSKIYADKAFDKWGEPTKDDIRVVEQWSDFDIPPDAEKIVSPCDLRWNGRTPPSKARLPSVFFQLHEVPQTAHHTHYSQQCGALGSCGSQDAPALSSERAKLPL